MAGLNTVGRKEHKYLRNYLFGKCIIFRRFKRSELLLATTNKRNSKYKTLCLIDLKIRKKIVEWSVRKYC